MKKFSLIIMAIVLLAASIGTGSVFAQEEVEPTPESAEDPEELEEPNPACEDELMHPAILRIADMYDMEYEELLVYFCEYDFGIGEIVHLLGSYAQAEEEFTLEEILAMRVDEEMGWGEIWQDLGMIGSGRGDSEEDDEPAALVRNPNRNRLYSQAEDDDDESPKDNGKPPFTPPGLDKEKGPNNLPGNGRGNKGDGHPGKGRKP